MTLDMASRSWTIEVIVIVEFVYMLDEARLMATSALKGIHVACIRSFTLGTQA